MKEFSPFGVNPVMDYTLRNLWANPVENIQYQVKINHIVSYAGVTKTFAFMNKWRPLPIPGKFFNVFNMGGLHPGYWNLLKVVLRESPLDKWERLDKLSYRKGVQFDIYDSKGYQYPRPLVWVMKTYDGLTLLAIEKIKPISVKKDVEMFLRCYTPSIFVTKEHNLSDANPNPFYHSMLVYTNSQELAQLNNSYIYLSNKPGFTCCFHNGAINVCSPYELTGLTTGDVIEVWHDPSVIRTEIYKYNKLQDFYSPLDDKRKLILHPPKNISRMRLRYFDDCDFYLLGATDRGLYLNKNNESNFRQLTHADISISEDHVINVSMQDPYLEKVDDLRLLVLVRDTSWKIDWSHEHSYVRYMYRMEDKDIVKALTGDRANMEEWSAPYLEQYGVPSYMRKQFKDINKVNSLQNLGYNQATRIASESVIKCDYVKGGQGVEIPVTYRDRSTVFEYDHLGHLIGHYESYKNKHWVPVNEGCKLLEFVTGTGGRELDILVTNKNETLDITLDYQVYVCDYSTLFEDIVGDWTNVTDDKDYYVIEGNTLVWTGLDKVNQRGIIVSNDKFIIFSLEMDHLDKSLSFNIDNAFRPGVIVPPVPFRQIDVWLNGHPLIDNVDWLYKDGRIYIINKEYIVSGPQVITVRAYGHSEENKSVFDTELGFIDGGVIGNFDRYNLRSNKSTRTVIGGSLFLTDEIPSAERLLPDDQWSVLNGVPYMVKHNFTPVKFVTKLNNYPGFNESKVLDKKVGEYLTKWLKKPKDGGEIVKWEVPEGYTGDSTIAFPNIQDKYRVYSPFLSSIINSLLSGILILPNVRYEELLFSGQDIEEVIKSYKWWLEFDPALLGFDQRYFAILPYNNFEKLVVNSKELQFIKQLNDIYLNSTCVIEGHFEINDNIR